MIFVLAACGESAPLPDTPVDAAVVDVTVDVPMDAGTDTRASESDTGPFLSDTGVDAPPPLQDAGQDVSELDTSPPLDAGADVSPDVPEPDAGPACPGTRILDTFFSSVEWSQMMMSASHSVLELSADLHRLEQYRLGLRVTAADPRARITIIVTGCETTVQICADQNDVSRKIPYPAPGHDGCQVNGFGTATMGLSCTFDNPPQEVLVIVDHGSDVPMDDPAYCRPAFEAEAFRVADPSQPSMF
ncbi:MAG: hypothetical protein MI867_13665 [Pseudomonadales bacterium]|nr:hypothetical protein [Pseudomonadales bacterium]